MSQRLRVVVVRQRLLLAAVLPFLTAVAACEAPPESGDQIEEPGQIAEPVEVPEEMEGDPLTLQAPLAPDPDTVHIESIQGINGTGCPRGTATASVAPDGLSVNVRFFTFTAARGPGIPISRSRLHCALILRIAIPQGHSFTLTQIDNRGSVNIPAGVTARQRSTYRMVGDSDQAEPATTEFKGPARREFLAANKYETQNLVWSPCGMKTDLVVDTSVQLSGSSSQMSTISIDDLNKNFVQRYRMRWRTCR